MSTHEMKDFIFEKYDKRIGFSKESSFIEWNAWKKKLIEKIPYPCNAKEHYQSFIRKKNTKSETSTSIPKTFDTVDIKSIITEHLKTSHKLSKIIRQVEKVIALYIGIQKKNKKFLNKKKVKITKWEHG